MSTETSADAAKRTVNPSKTIRAGLAAAAILVLWTASSPAVAGELSLSGFVAFESRPYFGGARFEEQADGAQTSLVAAPEVDWRSANGRHRLSFDPFLRFDGTDGERTHFDLREASWRYLGDDWELLLGVDRVFWGVTESRHLVDVLNQDDAVEDVDGEDKLGQPMVAVQLLRDWGTLGVYLMPMFRERTFPGSDGRLRPPLPVDSGDARYESSAGDRHLDFALRYSTYFGDWDLGLSYFDGTGREPRLLPDGTGERTSPRRGANVLVPHYDLIRQAGIDVQYTRSAWLWKLEGIYREGHGPAFGAFVGGFEYTLYQIGGTAGDLGLIAEVLYDGRDPRLAPPTVFEDDLFLGGRWALNDVQDTAVLVGWLLDREDGSAALSIEAERRLVGGWKVEVESRLFLDVAARNSLASLEGDDFMTLRLSRYF